MAGIVGDDASEDMRIAFGIEASSPQPSSCEIFRQAATGTPEDAYVNDVPEFRITPEALVGLTALERKGQAAMLMGRARDILGPFKYDYIVAFYQVPHNDRAARDKAKAIMSIVMRIQPMFRYDLDYIKLVVAWWAAREPDWLIPSHRRFYISQRTEQRHRRKIRKYLYNKLNNQLDSL